MLLSPTKIFHVFKGNIHRFYSTIFFITLWWLFTFIPQDLFGAVYSTNLNFFFNFYPLVASFISLAVTLHNEQLPKHGIGFLFQITCLIYFILTAFYIPIGSFVQTYEALGILMFVILMGITSPFLYRKDDQTLSQLTIRLLTGLLIAFTLSTIALALIALLINFIFVLLEKPMSMEIGTYVANFCYRFICPILIISLIPSAKALKKGDLGINTYPIARSIANYLLLPLVLLYMSVLYLYMGKIIITWELPIGNVCWPTVTLLASVLIWELVNYIFTNENQITAKKKFSQWIPYFMIPLLILMSVAIGRRVADYGITAPRLYMVALNLFGYVCIALLIFNQKYWVRWAMCCGALFALLTSVGPQSINNSVIRYYKHKISSSVQGTSISLPLTKENTKEWISIQNDRGNEDVIKMMRYIQVKYDNVDFKGYVSKNLMDFPINSQTLNKKLYFTSEKQIPVQSNYKFVKVVSKYERTNKQDSIAIRCLYTDCPQETYLEFPVTMNEIENHCQTKDPSPWLLQTDNACLVLRKFEIEFLYDEIAYYFEGYLFTN